MANHEVPALAWASTILMIDDDPHAQVMLSTLLAQEAYRLCFAADGLTGLDQAAALLPDVILLDVMLPGIDGYEVCQRLRANPRLAEVPILMLTVLTDAASRLRGLQAGADDFLSKPFDRSEMIARLRVITRLNRYRTLLTERHKFQQFIDFTSDGIILCDEANRVAEWNGAMERIAGVPRAAALGRPLWELLPPPTAAEAPTLPVPGETRLYPIRRPDGADRILESSAFLIPGEGAFRMGAIVRDLTERRQAQQTIERLNEELRHLLTERTARLEQEMAAHAQAEQSLQESQSLFRVALELSLEGFAILRAVRAADGQVVDFVWSYANPAAARIVRQPIEGLIGHSLMQTSPGTRTNPALFERYVRIVETGQGDVVEHRHQADGVDGWFRDRTIRLGDGVAVAFSDITAQKEAEETLRLGKAELERRVAAQTAVLQETNDRLRQEITERHLAELTLRESERRLKRSQEVAHVGHWTWDIPSGRVTWSDELYRIAGLVPQAQARRVDELLPLPAHPADAARVAGLLAALVDEQRAEEAEYRVVWPDGTARALWLLPGDCVLGPQGEPWQLTGVVQDITERKAAEAELRQREEALLALNMENARLAQQTAEIESLRLADRLRSELIANVSHELRTPLGLILMACTTLQRTDLTLEASIQQQFLGAIRDETRKLQDIVENLLNLSRMQGRALELHRQVLPVEPLVRDTLDRLAPLLGQHTVACVFPPEPLVAVMDAPRIEQVLRNLLSNAAKYSPAGTTITVGMRAQGNFVVVQVLDEGIGLSADDQAHLFERFYRGRHAVVQRAAGLGLGLPICRNLIEAHGGRIWAEPRNPAGAMFAFSLPSQPLAEPTIAEPGGEF